METKTLMHIPLNDEKKENCWFIALLTSLYSSYTKDLIMNKNNNEKENLRGIVKKLLSEYYYYNNKSLNFFHIITPEILLLKSLSLIKRNDLREFIIRTKNFELPMSLMCDFHHNLAINCFKLMTIDNNNYYCEINDNYDLIVDDDNLKYQNNMMMNITDIKTMISTLLNDKPEMILIQKDNENTDEANILKMIIQSGIDYEKAFNLKSYAKSTDTYQQLDDIIFINNNKYQIDTCIIKSSNDNNYIILLHYNNKKYMYDIKNGLLNENEWDLKTFNYNEYNFANSPSVFITYISIDKTSSNSL